LGSLKNGVEKIGRGLQYYRQMKMVGMLSGCVSIYRSITVSIYHSAIGYAHRAGQLKQGEWKKSKKILPLSQKTLGGIG
jgi:hypothetical protein